MLVPVSSVPARTLSSCSVTLNLMFYRTVASAVGSQLYLVVCITIPVVSFCGTVVKFSACALPVSGCFFVRGLESFPVHLYYQVI